MKEKIVKILLCTAAVIIFAGCGEREKPGELSYEQPLNAMRLAVNYGDEQSYLSLWLPQEKLRFTSAEGYSEGFLKQAYDADEYESKLRLKVRSAEVLSDEDISLLEEDAHERYGTRLDFSKAMRVSLDLRVEKNNDMLSDQREITVVRYENIWYLYGETIDSFVFARS